MGLKERMVLQMRAAKETKSVAEQVVDSVAGSVLTKEVEQVPESVAESVVEPVSAKEGGPVPAKEGGPVVEQVAPCLDISKLSRKKKLELGDMLLGDFGEILEKAGLGSETAADYMPKELVAKAKAKTKSKAKVAPFTDWRLAAQKVDLEYLKKAELVDICKEAGIPTSSVKKGVLVDRVWGIEHEDEAPVITTGKRGRPKGSSNGSPKEGVVVGVVGEVGVGGGETKDELSGSDSSSDSGSDSDDISELTEVRFDGDKLDESGSDIYYRYNGSDYIVSGGDDIDYIGKLVGDTLSRGVGSDEFVKFLGED